MMLDVRWADGGRMCQYPKTVVRRVCIRVVTNWRQQAGAEVLEAALVLPLLFMLLLGIVTFGRAYNIYQTITRAAREGARELVLTSCATCGNTSYAPSYVQTNFVNPVLLSANLDPTNSVYTSSYTTSYVLLDPNDPIPDICGVQISFKYPYKLTLPFTSLNLSTINLSTTVQMRMEQQPATCTPGPVS